MLAPGKVTPAPVAIASATSTAAQSDAWSCDTCFRINKASSTTTAPPAVVTTTSTPAPLLLRPLLATVESGSTSVSAASGEVETVSTYVATTTTTVNLRATRPASTAAPILPASTTKGSHATTTHTSDQHQVRTSDGEGLRLLHKDEKDKDLLLRGQRNGSATEEQSNGSAAHDWGNRWLLDAKKELSQWKNGGERGTRGLSHEEILRKSHEEMLRKDNPEKHASSQNAGERSEQAEAGKQEKEKQKEKGDKKTKKCHDKEEKKTDATKDRD
ncbi:hypothetical protein CEK25_008495 [Fusarium fujikuroi]|nr:hypothetical protein CEK25_008495 [Fusarium fujikuroi]